MKNVFLLLCMHLSISSVAQEIEIKKDMVWVDGVEAFKINGGALSATYSVENRSGKKLIFFKVDNDNKNANGTAPYVVSFTGYQGLTASFQGSIPVKKSIAKEIIENDLIEDDELNEQSVLRYCGASAPKAKTLTLGSKAYTPVARNTSAPFFAAAGEIKQDFKLVGKYKSTTETENGKQRKTITISGTNNAKIAIAQYDVFSEMALLNYAGQAEAIEITIPKANDVQVLESIIQYIIDDGKL
jgi:hypothetical protein